MKCVRCSSLRMVKFVDGFGQRRIFCRSCWGSFLEFKPRPLDQKILPEFNHLEKYKVGNYSKYW